MKTNPDKKHKPSGNRSKAEPTLNRTGIMSFAAFILLVFYSIYDSYLHSSRMGHDYKYFIPHLLDGAFWFHVNGLFSIPWFTPSVGGGLPNFPNPQSLYYSIPQFLTCITDPITSIRITMMLFAAAGFMGFYLVLKRVFNLTSLSSALGAAFFMFNGFYAHRMLVGHLTYHSFMLFPFLLYSILNGNQDGIKSDWKVLIRDIAVGGLVIAYLVYSGAFYLIPMFLLTILLCVLVYGFISGDKMSYLAVVFRLILVVLIGTFAGASKLNAGFSYVALFPRNLYPLPGVDSLFSLMQLTFQSLFLEPDASFANEVTVNRKFRLDRHEYEFGIGLSVLFLLIYGLVGFIKKYFSSNPKVALSVKQKIELFTFLLLAFIPVILNFYTPGLNEFLKSLPFVTSTSTNIRWLCVYIPSAVLLASIIFNNVKVGFSIKLGIGLVLVLFLLIDNASRNRKYYKNQRYNPVFVTEKYKELKSGKLNPKISNIGNSAIVLFRNREITVQGNELFAFETSRLRPYEPIFGYKLENFPMAPLVEGDPLKSFQPGILNLKNPAGYLFPEENSCSPGGHYRIDQKGVAEAFLQYKPVTFNMPAIQVIANYISLFTCTLVLATLFFTGIVLPLVNRLKSGRR